MLIAHGHYCRAWQAQRYRTAAKVVVLLAGPPMLKMHALTVQWGILGKNFHQMDYAVLKEWTAECLRARTTQEESYSAVATSMQGQASPPHWGLKLIFIPLAACRSQVGWLWSGAPGCSNCWCGELNNIYEWWPLVIAHYKTWCFERKYASNFTRLWWDQQNGGRCASFCAGLCFSRDFNSMCEYCM